MSLIPRGHRVGLLALVIVLIGIGAGCARRERVDPTEGVFTEFAKRVDAYVAVQNQIADSVGVLDETTNQAEIAARATLLANGIIEARANAKQGDIFSPDVAAVISTMIQEEYRRRPVPVQDSREDAQDELPDFQPQVNQIYPTTYPLATFPATLLPLLPELPKELEYRIVSRNLILRDVEANLIIDYMPNAIP